MALSSSWGNSCTRSYRYTVSLASHDPSFCCDDRTVKINTSLESSWSTKLKFVTFDLNRGIFDELQYVIDSAAMSD